jgi:hypothetical protein
MFRSQAVGKILLRFSGKDNLATSTGQADLKNKVSGI